MKCFSVLEHPFLCALLAATVALAGGTAEPAVAQKSSPQDLALKEEFKPIPSGPGIHICEPVAPSGDAALADFGGGCGLWLQWSMGFHPELGQTPRWEQVDRVHRELKIPHVRLSLAQSPSLVRVMGVTHVALGQISGTPEKCLLTYQLYAMPAQKAIGGPIKLAGTEEQIVAQLPQASQTLLTRLGVAKTHVPASVGATAAELTIAGHYPWYQDQKPTEAEQQQIDSLGQKFPLAALLAYGHSGGTLKVREDAARHLLEQMPGNFLILGAVATSITAPTEEFGRFVDSQVAAMNAPTNMPLAYWAINRANTQDAKTQAFQRLPRLAPHSSTAWNVLARQYGNEQQSIRLSRIFAGLSPLEVETLTNLYFRWVYAATQATTLDPDYEDAWLELATAATFASDAERADAAFWKAYALDKSDPRLYIWGLEMYQTKWGGDPKTLAKVARLSLEAPFPDNANFFDLGSALRSAGFSLESRAMIARAVVQARGAVRLHPSDSATHATLGFYLLDQQQPEEAETELKTAIQLNPDSDPGHFQLAKLYQASKQWDEAIAQYRECVRIMTGPGHKPLDSFGAKIALAETLYNASESHFEEAEKLLDELLKLEPNSYRANADRGWVLSRRGQYDAAIDVLKTAAQLAPDASFPPREIGRAYRLQSKFDEAVRAGEMAVAIGPKDYYALSELAETYAAKGDKEASLKMRKRAVDTFPNFAQGHFNLGEFYLTLEKKDEAKAEFKRVLELNPSDELKKAAQGLLDKNP